MTLFKKQLEIHGVSKFISLLIDSDDGGGESELEKEDDCSSVDILSDSDLGSNEGNIDGRDSDDSDDGNHGERRKCREPVHTCPCEFIDRISDTMFSDIPIKLS